MGDSNMDAIKSFKNMNSSEKEEATFAFNSLPWVCQKRFTEICDPETLKTFAQINPETRNLVKRCHTIEYAEITMNVTNEISCKYKVACYCNENEYCKGINADDFTTFYDKFNVLNSITIKAAMEQKFDALFLHYLPINLYSCKRLKFFVKSMDLGDLKKLIAPEWGHLEFRGGFNTNDSLEEFIDFIKSLSSQLDSFFFYGSSTTLSFNVNALLQQCHILKSQAFIKDFITIQMPPNVLSVCFDK